MATFQEVYINSLSNSDSDDGTGGNATTLIGKGPAFCEQNGLPNMPFRIMRVPLTSKYRVRVETPSFRDCPGSRVSGAPHDSGCCHRPPPKECGSDATVKVVCEQCAITAFPKRATRPLHRAYVVLACIS